MFKLEVSQWIDFLFCEKLKSNNSVWWVCLKPSLEGKPVYFAEAFGLLFHLFEGNEEGERGGKERMNLVQFVM